MAWKLARIMSQVSRTRVSVPTDHFPSSAKGRLVLAHEMILRFVPRLQDRSYIGLEYVGVVRYIFKSSQGSVTYNDYQFRPTYILSSLDARDILTTPLCGNPGYTLRITLEVKRIHL